MPSDALEKWRGARAARLDNLAAAHNVNNDFARLGMSIKTELSSRYPKRSGAWTKKLELLNDARNAIAHDNAAQLAASHAEQPLTFATFRAWRSGLDQMASDIDEVVAAYLKDLNGEEPW